MDKLCLSVALDMMSDWVAQTDFVCPCLWIGFVISCPEAPFASPNARLKDEVGQAFWRGLLDLLSVHRISFGRDSKNTGTARFRIKFRSFEF